MNKNQRRDMQWRGAKSFGYWKIPGASLSLKANHLAMLNYPALTCYFPKKTGFRFSKKADVPSLKSSVAKHAPKASISDWYPVLDEAKPAFTALMAFPKAKGAF